MKYEDQGACREQALQGTNVPGKKRTREQPSQRESVQFNKSHRQHTRSELKTKKGKHARRIQRMEQWFRGVVYLTSEEESDELSSLGSF